MTAGSLARLQKFPGGRYGHVCIDALRYMVVACVLGLVYECKITRATELPYIVCAGFSVRVQDCEGDRVATNATGMPLREQQAPK